LGDPTDNDVLGKREKLGKRRRSRRRSTLGYREVVYGQGCLERLPDN
jgi:hypothetical protein